MKKVTIALCISLFFLQINFFAQSNDFDPKNFLPNIVPPSPEAFKLGSYGNIPIGHFSGSPNIEIPLISFNSKASSVPFKLNYSSNGIKVDDVNTIVGLGWNFIGGGVINRIVRDQPDEESNLIIPPLLSSGYTDPMFYQYVQNIGENPEMDSEQDIFSYSFNGVSGKFVFDQEKNIINLPRSENKIELLQLPNDNVFNFLITTKDGMKYYFEEEEKTMLRTSGEGHPEPDISSTAWYLTKIVHPNGHEIYFTYSNYSQYYISSKSQQFTKSYPSVQAYTLGSCVDVYTNHGTFSEENNHHIRIVGKRLSSIYSNNPYEGVMTFHYSEMFPSQNEEPDEVIERIEFKNINNEIIEKVNFYYQTTTNKRIFLSKINYLDPSNQYKFNYINPDNFPVRLSKSQDHYGFYNGANNSHLIPSVVGYGFENMNYNAADRDPNPLYSNFGLLNIIEYPTTGSSEIIYEPNSYYGLKKILPPLTSQTIISNTDLDIFNNETTYNLFSHFSQDISILGISYFSNCDDDMNTGQNHHKGIVSVYCVEDDKEIDLFKYNALGDLEIFSSIELGVTNSNFYFNAEQNKNYVISLRNNFNCTYSRLDVSYYNDNYNEIYENIIAGGNRVQKIRSSDNFNNNINITRYYYNKPEDVNKSSGVLNINPIYLELSKKEIPAQDTPCASAVDNPGGILPRQDLVLSSSSLNSLYSNGSYIAYKYVTTSLGGDNFEKGGETKEFIINPDVPGNPLYNSDDIKNAPYNNIGWNNGIERSNTIFDFQGNPKQTTINDYELENYLVESKNYSARKKYDQNLFGNVSLGCTEELINYAQEYTVCTANHQHKYVYQTWNDNSYCVAAGYINQTYTYYHPCHNKQVGEMITFPNYINNIDVVEYSNFAYWYNLKHVKTIDYLNENIENEKYYNYSLENLQLESEKLYTSSNRYIETRYFYPTDSEMSIYSWINDLLNKDIIGTPIKIEKYLNDGGVSKKLVENYTEFSNDVTTSNLCLPKYIYLKKGDEISIPLEKKITYDLYDNKGNLKQYTIENAPPVSIIWGYNQTKPIAKIEGVSYVNLPTTYIDAAISASNTGTEYELLSALNALRMQIPNAMISTYTYKPLIGVSSVTDPKGDTQYYFYDNFNRLQYVKDKDSNILSENQYHYRPIVE